MAAGNLVDKANLRSCKQVCTNEMGDANWGFNWVNFVSLVIYLDYLCLMSALSELIELFGCSPLQTDYKKNNGLKLLRQQWQPSRQKDTSSCCCPLSVRVFRAQDPPCDPNIPLENMPLIFLNNSPDKCIRNILCNF